MTLGPISQQAAQGEPASVQIYTKTGLRRAFPSRWPREAPPPYKFIRKVASGGHSPTGRPGGPRQRTNLYQNWPPEGVSLQVAQGSPATVQIYTKTDLWGPFPSRWPREGPPAYKSIPELASGGHFPAGGPGKPRHRTNLYEKWPLGGISQQMTQGGALQRISYIIIVNIYNYSKIGEQF